MATAAKKKQPVQRQVLDGRTGLFLVKGGQTPVQQAVAKQTRAQAFINGVLAEAGKKNQRVYLEVDNFLNVTYVRAQVGRRIEARLFLDDVEQFGSWMYREDRIKFIIAMLPYGYRYKRIGTMLGFSASTISKDVAWIRENCPEKLSSEKQLTAIRTKFSYAAYQITGQPLQA